MRKTSVRELHIHTSELVREAAEGGVIVIERRGEPVAELRPVTAPLRMNPAKKGADFHFDGGSLVAHARGRRQHADH